MLNDFSRPWRDDARPLRSFADEALATSERLARAVHWLTAEHLLEHQQDRPGRVLGSCAARPPRARRELSVKLGRLLRVERRFRVNNIIYIIGLIVVVLAILSFFGLR